MRAPVCPVGQAGCRLQSERRATASRAGVCAWGGGRGGLPPGWEVSATRSPGSAVTGGPIPPACQRSPPGQPLPLPTLILCRFGGELPGTLTKGPLDRCLLEPSPLTLLGLPLGEQAVARAWEVDICPSLVVLTTGSMSSGISKTLPRAPLPTAPYGVRTMTPSMLQGPQTSCSLATWPVASGSPL